MATVGLAVAGSAAALGSIDGGATVGITASRPGHTIVVDSFLPAAPATTYLISDSVLAGIATNGALGRLTGTRWLPDLEVCRRLVATSCSISGSPRPPTVVDEIAARSAQVGASDLLVVATGYNDPPSRFAADVASVITAARAAGFEHIAWLTYRADGSSSLFSGYARMNDILRAVVASGAYPELTLWDFDAFTAGNRSWFAADNLHLSNAGAAAIATWLSQRATIYDTR